MDRQETQDTDFLLLAIENARTSVASGGFPAGAVVVKNNTVIGHGISIGQKIHDPTSHGEMAAIRDACQNLKTADLSGCILYASMEPCLMCFGASMWCGIPSIVFACRRSQVSPAYYGGHYDINDINKNLLSDIKMIHWAALEQQSLSVVRQWERAL